MTEQELKEIRGEQVVLKNKFGGIYLGRLENIKTSKGRRKVALSGASFCSASVPDILYQQSWFIGTRWFFVDDIDVWLFGQQPMTVNLDDNWR